MSMVPLKTRFFAIFTLVLSDGPVTGPVGSPACPEGWTISGGSCFKYLREHYDFDAAAEACRAFDARATLATIVDDEQNLAVAKLVTGSGDAWIGRQLVNGNEIWKSGSTSFLEICVMDHYARQLRHDFKIHARRLNSQLYKDPTWAIPERSEV